MMGSGHSHDHASQADFSSAFAAGIALNLGFVVVEAFYGFFADSMALLADAGHNLSDVLGLVLAWAGAALVKRRPNARFSYGLKKSSILAALLNALLLLVAMGAIIAEAIRRLGDPEVTDGGTVIWVAAIGILVNGVTAWLFARGRHHDINIRGAFLHMVADAAVSVGVVLAGFLILKTGQSWIDPVTSLVIAAIILWSTWDLLTESATMTLAGVPKGIDSSQVGRALEKLPGVTAIHHLHIWSLSTTETALTVHLVVDDECDRDKLIRQANAYVHQLFGISHSTIQVESPGMDHDDHCHDTPSHRHHHH
ncbi:cation diffusion facilitator family transporter [Sphingomonas alba]|uniref:Cation diffusion facilitator family transporter n=1 Tax=Sphingomonas alba TaxID=2908208 RepID=A0ABT0RPL9_9SPHN|nr:cation diffusion facilitator family transporter [Sphingomonas alba]MCL6684606.1 cation diffusion facilitator family transporter [Sphingomonas alba]